MLVSQVSFREGYTTPLTWEMLVRSAGLAGYAVCLRTGSGVVVSRQLSAR
jgi:hypothetical protein